MAQLESSTWLQCAGHVQVNSTCLPHSFWNSRPTWTCSPNADERHKSVRGNTCYLLLMALTLPLTLHRPKQLLLPNAASRGKEIYSSHNGKHCQFMWQTNNNPIFHWPGVICLSNYKTHVLRPDSRCSELLFYFSYIRTHIIWTILLWSGYHWFHFTDEELIEVA